MFWGNFRLWAGMPSRARNQVEHRDGQRDRAETIDLCASLLCQ